MLSIFPKVSGFKIISKRRFAYLLSSVVIITGIFSFYNRGEKNFGIDFTGGVLQDYEFKNEVSTNDIRVALSEIGLGDSLIQQVRNTGRFIIRTYSGVTEDIVLKLKDTFGQENTLLLRTESVGAIVGEDLKKKAIMAIVFALIAMCIYISIRFKFKFAIAAIIAIIHDVLICVGAMSLSQRELSLPVIAALLTIVGYSINDTIVVFDRIRENMHFQKKMDFPGLTNLSINQTLSRTLLTSFTTLLTVLALFIFGGEIINPFSFVLLVGVLVGTYSSVFIASPVVVDWMRGKKD